MLLNKQGEIFLAVGKRFTIGGEVLANGSSEYAGLLGTVHEIADGDDQATENRSADIFCDFDPPESPALAKELEQCFSALYQHKKTLAEISLDDVIMAADMLEPIARACISVSSVYVLSSLRDGGCGTARQILGVSASKGALLRRMFDELETDAVKRVLSYVKEEAGVLTLVFEPLDPDASDSYLDYELAQTPIVFDRYEVAA